MAATITFGRDRPRLFDDPGAALSPRPPAAAGAAHRSRSALQPRPGPACGASDDDPRRMQHGATLLDDVVCAVWEGLSAHRAVACPVCRGPMEPWYGSGVQPVGGRCSRCGSSLG
jgi:hypothetical protein